MKQSVRDLGPHLKVFEASCFDGRYITGDVSPEYLDRIEAARNAATDAAEDTGPKAQMNLQFSMLNADSR
jgi:amidophosphoribosyltransferase